MPIKLEDFSDEQLVEKGIDPGLREYFFVVPSKDDLKLTEREKNALDQLWRWHEDSKKAYFVIGEPYNFVISR